MSDESKSLFFEKYPFVGKDGAITNSGRITLTLPNQYTGKTFFIYPVTNGTTTIYDNGKPVSYLYEHQRALARPICPWYRKLFGLGPKWKIVVL